MENYKKYNFIGFFSFTDYIYNYGLISRIKNEKPFFSFVLLFLVEY
jgi:hypothetical protein